MAKSQSQKYKSKKQKQQQQKQQQQQGGSSFTEMVYGAPNQQHAIPGSNVIDAKYVSNCATVGAMKGGRKSRKQQQQQQDGGNVIQDIAVPAILLYANQTFGRRRTSRHTKPRYSFKRRSARRSSSRR